MRRGKARLGKINTLRASQVNNTSNCWKDRTAFFQGDSVMGEKW